jgi:ABC-type nitrate/sulfonate/bicarbonate transport system ATPase subunit
LLRASSWILVGPSGCGKSTLLQIMAGLEAPSSGEVRFPAAPGGGSGKLTSMVFQDYALFPWRTVLGNVAFGPEVRGVPKREREARARRLIDLVNLRGAEDRYPRELSGGMRQRVALARALANDPQILLFDEPLAALDAQTRRVMQDELLRIWAETGKTFVYVTHSLEEAVRLGTRIVLMTAGPGRIKQIAEVTLPRPRHLTGREEAALLDRLDALLGEEVQRAMAS